ncbi:MAG: vitamin B12-dependent ribonucleotide reductase [Candidatus Poribacteria bacterium]|nr:vitamin B12-dependent ribonucleotide reductase [Candidatus Poribacteria bacterium]
MANSSHMNPEGIAAAPSDEASDIEQPLHDPATQDTQKRGLKIRRHYTTPGLHPFDEMEWEHRRSVIYNEKGEVIFQQKSVEVPVSWSQLATDIVVSKYFRKAGVPETEEETSVRQVIRRVANTIRQAGEALGGYFATPNDADAFEAELTDLLVTQRGAFNSPVWFNCGLYHQYGIKGGSGNWYWDFEKNGVVQTDNNYDHPQCSACFIQSIDDDLMSIFELVKNEARVFKYGSGTGTNFSKIRGCQEKLSGGGTSSGLMSFLVVFDRGAGATKSGGTTRRAAKMVCLDMDHPEIVDFINWKMNEEKKVVALVAAGYSADFNGEAYKTVSGQNSNNSVRLSDEFMNAYLRGDTWHTTMRTTGEVCKSFEASDLMHQIATAAWACADPGVQFDTTINDWHTCSNTDRIYSSNPCSEYMFLDDSACNLASINLLKFLDEDGNFDVEGFKHACRIFFIGQEILVDFSSYPTKPIAQNSHDYRPLGLGYANLGTLLMVSGIPYDSEAGYAICGAITAILCGEAFRTSAEMAAVKSPFSGFEKNREPMLRVMSKHRAAAYRINPDACPAYLLKAAQHTWDEAVEMGEKFGYRNAQATVLAPTGTIGLLMECDTTGIEPEFALVKFKKLTGGGYFKIINQSVPLALKRLGYMDEEIDDIVTYGQGTSSLIGTPHINNLSLKAKGLTDEEIGQIEAALSSVFELDHAINIHTIGGEGLARLGFRPEQYNAPDFDLLSELGFTAQQIEEANNVICGMMTLEGAPHLKAEHLPIFDCANKCGKYGQRYIEPMGHVRMLGAAQPFLSGSISKTINMPHEATVEEVEQVYVEAWKLGLKAVAIYRDRSKLSQPLSASRAEKVEEEAEARPIRRRLPDERPSITHKFSIAGHDGYITAGLYEDGSPGEVFLKMAKEGSVISGLMDTIATMTSIALQYGVPLESLVNKFSHVRFEPSGFTNNKDIPIAKSIIDYIFRWLGLKFLPQSQALEVGDESLGDQLVQPQQLHPYPNGTDEAHTPQTMLTGEGLEAREQRIAAIQSDAPACHECGTIMVRNGTCYRCLNCGATSGCS